MNDNWAFRRDSTPINKILDSEICSFCKVIQFDFASSIWLYKQCLLKKNDTLSIQNKLKLKAGQKKWWNICIQGVTSYKKKERRCQKLQFLSPTASSLSLFSVLTPHLQSKCWDYNKSMSFYKLTQVVTLANLRIVWFLQFERYKKNISNPLKTVTLTF